MARGKVGCGGREIMRALWGDRGRPESNEYADRCAERAIAHRGAIETLRVTKTYVPESDTSSRLVESPRTSQKWAAARARHRNPEGE